MGKTRFGVEPRSWLAFLAVPRSFPCTCRQTLGPPAIHRHWRGEKAQERGSGPDPSHAVLQTTLTEWGALPVYARVSVHMAMCATTLVNTLEFTCTRICPHEKVCAHNQGGPHGSGFAGSLDSEGCGRVQGRSTTVPVSALGGRAGPSPVSPLHPCRAMIGALLALRLLRGKETNPLPRLPLPYLCGRAFSPVPLRHSLTPPSFSPSSLSGSLLALPPGAVTERVARAGAGAGAGAGGPLSTGGGGGGSRPRSERSPHPRRSGPSPDAGLRTACAAAARRPQPWPRPRCEARLAWTPAPAAEEEAAVAPGRLREQNWARGARVVHPEPSCSPARRGHGPSPGSGWAPAGVGRTDSQPREGSRTDGRRCWRRRRRPRRGLGRGCGPAGKTCDW